MNAKLRYFHLLTNFSLPKTYKTILISANSELSVAVKYDQKTTVSPKKNASLDLPFYHFHIMPQFFCVPFQTEFKKFHKKEYICVN